MNTVTTNRAFSLGGSILSLKKAISGKRISVQDIIDAANKVQALMPEIGLDGNEAVFNELVRRNTRGV